jgi:rSAM/selenodomain-associated transferase 1
VTDRVVVVFAKRPAPGAVKTRMCPPLTPTQAAALYAAMLDDVLATTARAVASAGAAAWLAVDPPDAVAQLARRCPPGFLAIDQRGADLGARMEHAVAAAAAAGFARVLLRGSDNPALPPSAIAAGFAALDDADLAVGPDRDGGYGWIALRGPAPGLFDHPMSTASVLDDTLARARGARTAHAHVEHALRSRHHGRSRRARGRSSARRNRRVSPHPGAPRRARTLAARRIDSRHVLAFELSSPGRSGSRWLIRAPPRGTRVCFADRVPTSGFFPCWPSGGVP